jgi:hypothetical protein
MSEGWLKAHFGVRNKSAGWTRYSLIEGDCTAYTVPKEAHLCSNQGGTAIDFVPVCRGVFLLLRGCFEASADDWLGTRARTFYKAISPSGQGMPLPLLKMGYRLFGWLVISHFQRRHVD